MSELRNWAGRGIIVGDQVEVVSGTQRGARGRVIASNDVNETCWVQRDVQFRGSYDYIILIYWCACSLTQKAPALVKLNLFDGFLVFSEGHWTTLKARLHKTQDAAREHILRTSATGSKYRLAAVSEGHCVQVKQHLEDITAQEVTSHE